MKYLFILIAFISLVFASCGNKYEGFYFDIKKEIIYKATKENGTIQHISFVGCNKKGSVKSYGFELNKNINDTIYIAKLFYEYHILFDTAFSKAFPIYVTVDDVDDNGSYGSYRGKGILDTLKDNLIKIPFEYQ